MNKLGIDQDALIKQFSEASAQQGEALRKSVQEATLKALQGRELTLKHIKDVLKSVTQAASAGAARNSEGFDVEAMLGKAVAGMDAAVEQAVEANRRALQQLVDQGVKLQESQLKKAMSDIEKMEDSMFAAINKAAGDAMQAPWAQALGTFKQNGSATGAGALAAVQQLTERAQAASREGRAMGQKATQALIDHYTALASGVLIGMSAGLQGGGAAPTAKKRSAAK